MRLEIVPAQLFTAWWQNLLWHAIGNVNGNESMFASLTMYPYVNPITLTNNNHLADIVEPSYPGYSAFSSFNESQDAYLFGDMVEIVSDNAPFRMDNSGPPVATNILGLALYSGSTFIDFPMAALLPNPIQLVNTGDGFSVGFRVRIGPGIPTAEFLILRE